MKKSLVIANWKMNKTFAEACAFASAILPQKHVEAVIAPPAPFLLSLHPLLKKKKIALAAQTMSEHRDGEVTGEISARMLKGWVRYVLLGHSERRKMFGETDEQVRAKGVKAFESGIIPVFCVGEGLKTRTEGQAFEFVSNQVKGIFKKVTKGWAQKAVIAYEPIWAIGQTKAASPDDVQDIHRYLRNVLGSLYGEASAASIRILYGGSVNPTNGAKLAACEDVDGFLVGRASLNVRSFEYLCKFFP